MLEVVDLCLKYGAQEVLKSFTGSFRKGEVTAIVGPSGGGKSSLVGVIAGHITPQSGRVLLGGELQNSKPSRKIWLINQDIDLFPWQTVEEHLKYVNASCDIDGVLKKVHLENEKNKYPKELSGGMKKRLALARALALSPEVLILDEVFSSQDQERRQDLLRELKLEWKRKGTIVLVVTHDVESMRGNIDSVVELSKKFI